MLFSSSNSTHSNDIKHSRLLLMHLLVLFTWTSSPALLSKEWNPQENMQGSLFMTHSFTFKIPPPPLTPPKNNFIVCSLCNISLADIVKLLFWEGEKTLGDKDLVISFYAYDGERRSSAPLRRDAHLKKQPELHMTPQLLTSPCPENWDLGRIKAEYFNLAPEFTWLCQSNYLHPFWKNAITETVKHTYSRGRYKGL